MRNALFSLAVLFALPAAAVEIVVDSTDNELNADGDCSLREALQAAETDAAVDGCVAGDEQDTVRLPAGTFPAPALTVATEVTLRGAGAASTVIDGQGTNALLTATNTLIVEDLTLRNAAGSAFIVAQNALGTLRRVEVRDNNAVTGGAVHNQGFLLIEFSTIADNIGSGGVRNEFFLSMRSSTVSGNTSAFDGAGVQHVGRFLSVVSCTIANNSATGSGGGLLNDRSLDGQPFELPTQIHNTILADNTAVVAGADCSSQEATTFQNLGANLIGTLAGCGGYTEAGNDQVGADPALLPLANNGGGTRTHALSQSPVTSAAIDTGDCEASPDQRGFLRPSTPPGNLPEPGFCDIGAYEISLLPIDGCTVVDNGDGTATIACVDGASFTIQPPVDGEDGEPCTVTENGDGTATITCGDGSTVDVQAGVDGNSCTVAGNGDGTSTISCTDGTSATVTDGGGCTVVENDDGSATITCDDGTEATVDAPPQGGGCSVTENDDGSATISCDDGTEATVKGGGCSAAGGQAPIALFGLVLLLGVRRARRRA